MNSFNTALVFLTQPQSRQQVRPPLPGPSQRLLAGASADRRVVSRLSTGGTGIPHLLGPRVVRTVQQALLKRVLRGRIRVAQHPSHAPATASASTSAGSSPPLNT